MTGLLQAEWIKWRSLRSSWILWGVILGLAFLIAGLFALGYSTADSVQREGAKASEVLVVVGGNPLTLLLTFVLLAVVGALMVTTEFSQNTIAPTFLSCPRRIPVLVNKLMLVVLIGIITASLAQVLALASGSMVLALNGISLPDAGAVLQNLAETAAYGACGALFGFAIGLLLRQSVFAVVTCILWAVLLEPISSGIMSAILGNKTADSITRFFPITALDGLLTATSEGQSQAAFSPAVSFLVFAAWVAVIAGIGTVLVNRADTK